MLCGNYILPQGKITMDFSVHVFNLILQSTFFIRFNKTQTFRKTFTNIGAVEYSHKHKRNQSQNIFWRSFNMKKKDFVTLIMSTVGGILFALGMCMGLIPEWNALTQGIIIGIIGVVILLAMVLVRRKMSGKPAIVLNGKAIGTALLGVVGAIVLGVGMCMSMIWNMMIPGIIVGIVGIVLLLCLIPVIKGLK
jgi:hypothetical protein